MPKKFTIRDEDGKQFDITEETVDEEPKPEELSEVKDEDALTPDELAALKELAKHASELISLLEVEKKEHEAVSDEDEEKEADVNDDDEEIIETKACDAKSSAGSVEKVKANDSIVDNDNEIADAWSKRFGAQLSKKSMF